MSLIIDQLSKTYPNGVKALDQVSLEISPGMFGLLGPNGAGKSTLMRTIATLQAPDEGRVMFQGEDIWLEKMALRKKLGYLPQEFGVYPRVSAEKLLDYFAILKGVADKKARKRLIGEVLELTNLQDVAKKAVSGYSGGMKQRFGIAQLLLNRPELIIVDEPTAGLDPAERQRFLNLLREIGTEHTVIFSTHIVDDVKELCHEIAVLQHGRLVIHESPEAALARLDQEMWTIQIPREELPQLSQTHTVLSSSFLRDHSLLVRIHSPKPLEAPFQPAPPQLEDAYFLALRSAELTPEQA
ncbi:MAG: ABC transporter ATP-binding protein [Bacteroidota bacterium]